MAQPKRFRLSFIVGGSYLEDHETHKVLLSKKALRTEMEALQEVFTDEYEGDVRISDVEIERIE